MKRKLITGCLFLLSISVFAAAPDARAAGTKSFLDSLSIKRIIKKNVVRLYPNPTANGNIKVSATGTKEELHFYVFDLEGTLMHQVTLKGKEKHAICNLKKGVYLYDVFLNDESIEQGSITVR